MSDAFSTTGTKGDTREHVKRDSFREQAGVVRDDLRELGKTGKEAARELLDEARDGAAHKLEQGREQLSGARDRLVSYVEENPMKSVLIAAAAGLVVGAIVSRRR